VPRSAKAVSTHMTGRMNRSGNMPWAAITLAQTAAAPPTPGHTHFSGSPAAAAPDT
jgi:hypothetical protein